MWLNFSAPSPAELIGEAGGRPAKPDTGWLAIVGQVAKMFRVKSTRATMSNEPNSPIHLSEDGQTGDRFLVYSTDKGTRIDIHFEGETLWMTQAQIADLFGRGRTTITKHINNILDERELDAQTSVQKMHTTTDRPATIYNLDMIISVGYRVSSAQATVFRRRATGV